MTTEHSTPADQNPFPFREHAERHEADVVVLGGGGAGIAAALAAAEAGARVVVLEKGNKPGGAAMFGGTGYAAYGSAAQREAGESFSAEEAVQAILEHTDGRADEALVRAVVARSGETADWLSAHGLKSALAEAPHDPADPGEDSELLARHRRARTYHRYASKFGGFKKLLKAIEEAGGLVIPEAAATEAVADERGRILGVRAERTEAGKPLSPERREQLKADGVAEAIDIAAPAVVVATGGFVGNHELVGRAAPELETSRLRFTGERKSVGTGRSVVQALGGAGAEPAALDAPAFSVPGRYSSKALAVLANLPLLWVDDDGRRFADEASTYHFGERGRAGLERGGRFWMILDSATVQRLTEQGLELAPAEDHGAPLPPGTEGTPAQPRLVEALEEAVEQGAAVLGAAPDDLAGAAGFHPERFAETLERYNAAVRTGRDDQFGTPAAILRHPVQEGPLYAVQVVSTVRGTLGGVRIDASARVLDADGQPVPGLYAAGNEASGFWGGRYPQIDGLTLLFAFNSGRIAGEAAAAPLPA